MYLSQTPVFSPEKSIALGYTSSAIGLNVKWDVLGLVSSSKQRMMGNQTCISILNTLMVQMSYNILIK